MLSMCCSNPASAPPLPSQPHASPVPRPVASLLCADVATEVPRVCRVRRWCAAVRLAPAAPDCAKPDARARLAANVTL
eukprot:15454316-Alexandrium_andersonii.AAC.1